MCGITTKPEGVCMSKKRVYTEEFKKQAVELSYELKSIAEAARQLGIRDVNIHKWRAQFKPSNPVTASESEEIKRLKKENEELKKVNYILKRAAAYFSQDHLK